MFYVSTCNVEGLSANVKDEDRLGWDKHWRAKDEAFERQIRKDPVLKKLSNKYFFVWVGNHRLLAWMDFISRTYPEDPEWHYAVGAMVLRTAKNVTSLLNAMHDINKATENSHVKSNLVHVLFRMQQLGKLSIDQFSSIYTAEELEATWKVLSSTDGKPKPWYKIPRAKFLEYLHSVRI